MSSVLSKNPTIEISSTAIEAKPTTEGARTLQKTGLESVQSKSKRILNGQYLLIVS